MISSNADKVLVKYNDLLNDCEIVDISQIRILTEADKSTYFQMLRIDLERIALSLLKNNFQIPNHLEFSSIVHRSLNIDNNFLGLKAFSLVGNLLFVLGEKESLTWANEAIKVRTLEKVFHI